MHVLLVVSHHHGSGHQEELPVGAISKGIKYNLPGDNITQKPPQHGCYSWTTLIIMWPVFAFVLDGLEDVDNNSHSSFTGAAAVGTCNSSLPMVR